MVKSDKLYMLKDKLSNFKMKDDEFLMCLPKKFKTLRTIIFRGGLTGVSPNKILGDVMTDA
jgi:hypothetical protein